MRGPGAVLRSVLLAVCVAALLPLTAAASGEERRPDVLAYRLQALPGTDVVDLATFRGRPGVLFVFEPGCVWCRRQARLLNELPDRCAGSVQVLGIGVRGSRAALLQEVRALHPQFPVFHASRDFTTDLGEPPSTPLLFVFGADGRIVTHARGYQRAEPMTRLLSLAAGTRCAG
jgi:hypothetical protein